MASLAHHECWPGFEGFTSGAHNMHVVLACSAQIQHIAPMLAALQVVQQQRPPPPPPPQASKEHQDEEDKEVG